MDVRGPFLDVRGSFEPIFVFGRSGFGRSGFWTFGVRGSGFLDVRGSDIRGPFLDVRGPFLDVRGSFEPFFFFGRSGFGHSGFWKLDVRG